MLKRWLALLLALVMVLSLAACTQSGGDKETEKAETAEKADNETKAAEETPAPDDINAEDVNADEFLGKPTDFTMMVANGIQDNYGYDANMENIPSIQWALNKEWDPDGNGNGRKITLDIWTPPSGGEGDYATRLISTGEYPDVMNIQIASMSAAEMYEDGMILDITDYVMKYMPNYRSFFERHPEYAGRETIMVDGERRYLCLYHLDEVAPGAWGGFLYRRDWIIKYGKNPETGAAFTGDFDEQGNWSDDVVFPSGETYPKYISDWEWMLDIFAKALEGEGIEDGYCFQLAARGENGVTGDFESGFGAANGWDIDPETGECVYGGTRDGFRAYLECMNNWYQKGWVQPSFYERAGEMFFMIDSGSVYSGKVGAWYGLQGQIGAGLGVPGSVVFPAPEPINDVYGDESCQNITPFCYYATGQFGAQWVVTDKAAEKDLPALFSYLDYFYDTEEGSLVKTFGLSKEQVEVCKTELPEVYKAYEEWGLLDGAYFINDKGMIQGSPVFNPQDDLGIGSIVKAIRIDGLTNEANYDRGFPDWYNDLWMLWRKYDFTKSAIGGEISAQLSPEQSANFQDVYNRLSTYLAQTVPEFVTGELDIHDDAAWEEFCAEVEGYDVQSYCDDINGILAQ